VTDPWIEDALIKIDLSQQGTRNVRIAITLPNDIKGGLQAAYDRKRESYSKTSKEPIPWYLQDTYYRAPNAVELDNHAPAQRYPSVCKCIYCGATEYQPGASRRLGDEHVICEGLGGNIILPEASCFRCERATGRIEQSLLKTLLWAPRRNLNIRGKKRKRNNDGFPVTSIVNGREVTFNLPIDKHPTFLVSPVLNPPGMAVGRSHLEPGLAAILLRELNVYDTLTDLGMDTLVLPILDTLHFCQMLAKIAHAFSVAELGLDGFIPLVGSFATVEFKEEEDLLGAYNFVGGDGTHYLEGTSLHTLGWGFLESNGVIVIGVHIRLFSSLGGPVYHVLTGELLPWQLERANARALTRAHMRGRTLAETLSALSNPLEVR
jgi:hypothetical protein